MIRRLPWHPALFAALVVVTLWVDSAVSPFAALRSLAVAIAIAVVLSGLAGLALRSARLGALVATGIIGLLWSKQLFALLAELGARMGALAIPVALLAVIALILVIRILRRSSPTIDRNRLTTLLNRASMLLLIATVILGGVGGHLAAVGADLQQGVGIGSWPAKHHPEHPASPAQDIYVILLDGYPRADVLEYAFGLDNSNFVNALRQRGFAVATASHSDYLWTHLSVPSALNMAYVEQIPAMQDVIEGRAPRQPSLRSTIADNVAFDVARAHGYVPVGIGSGFEEVAPRRADVYVDGGQLNEFEVSLLSSTFAGDLINVIAPDFASGQQRDRIKYNLSAVGEIAAIRDRDPALVFAHVPSPHQPTVLGEGDGVAVPLSKTFYADSPIERGEDPDEFRDRYRAALPRLNDLIIEAVDGILARSLEPPVIVLFADHGSASAVDWNQTQVEDGDPARLLERTGTLFAALTPGRRDVFPDDISPVDLFRLLFDAYLGTDYGRAVPPRPGGQVAPVDASVLGG